MHKRVRHALAATMAAAALALSCWGGASSPAAAYAETTNVALNKQVTVSQAPYDTLSARALVDGDHATRWSAEAEPTQWAYVDLGSATKVSQVKLWWESDAEYAVDFNIYVSDSTTDWGTPAKAVTGAKGATSEVTLDKPVSGRYVKLEITKVSNYPNVSCGEMEVYGEGSTAPAPEPQNLALKKTTKANVDYNKGESGDRAVDGKKDNGKTDRWMTETDPTAEKPLWVYVDLGKSETIKYLDIYWEGNGNHAVDFKVYASDSTDAWGEPIVAKVGNDQDRNSITLEKPATGRYVKLEISKENSGWGASCMEFEVWNEVPPAPDKQPADYLNDITVDPVTADTKTLSYHLPEAPAGYEITYNGTDYEQVIDTDGTIYHPISTVKVKASFKISNTADAADYAFREIEVEVPGTMTAPAGANPAPKILPELREWVGGTGVFANARRVVWADVSLKEMAEQFASDYATVTGKTLTVVEGTGASSGDILFTLTDDTSLGLKDEGYLLAATAQSITVTAEQVAGANWGGKTILQGMKQAGNATFPVGTSRDYPLYRVRGLILDVGRKTFTLDWLKQMTQEMAWYKMNDFQVHLNDNLIPLENYTNAGEDAMQAYSGFRLESDIKKGGNNGLNQADLTSTDVWYSKADFKEFIEQSKALGVNIVPEIDTPAHSLALTKVRPDLRYGTNGRQNDHLDLRGDKFEQSLAFVTSIFNEYVKGGKGAVFAGADVIHVGADEYNVGTNAESSPLYRKFVNEMFDYAYENGHTPRVWGSLSQYTTGDAIHTGGENGKPRAQINLWNWGYANMDKMYEMGFDLIDCNDGHFYIVPNAGYYYDYLNDDICYNNALNNIGSVTIPAGDPQIAGGAFAVWNDMCDMLENGMSEYDVYDRISNSLGLFAANGWGKGALTTAQAKERAGELADAPSTNFGYEAKATEDGVFAQWNMDDLTDASGMGRDLVATDAAIERADGRSALKLGGGSSYAEVKDGALTTLGLGNDLRVKVKRTSASTDDQILFESAYGTIKAVQGDTGCVGITRENRDYSFNYTLPVNEWVELEIKNEFELTHLYVNGELVDTIGSHDLKSVKATCMLPVGRIGSAEHAFVGYVDDVRLTTQAAAGEGFNSTMELDHAVISAEAVLADRDVPGLRALLDQAYGLFKQVNPDKEQIAALIRQIDELLRATDYEKADYRRVEAYLQLQPADDGQFADLFTDESLARTQAVAAMIRPDLPAGMQDTVDGYERALVAALDALELKDGGELAFIDPATLTAAASDSQADGSDPANVLDGDVGTIWHSNWNITSGEHWLSLASKTPMSVNGIVYTPRQTGTNGNIQQYRIEVSTDGTTFKQVADGTLEVKGTDPITLSFDQQDAVRAVRLVWVKGLNGNAAAAEIRLLDAAAAPDYERLQAVIDAAEAVSRGEEPARFSDATWDAMQQKLAEAKACVKDQTGDIESVYALSGELAKSVVSLRLDEVPAPDPDPDPDETTFTVTIDDRVPGHEDVVLTVKKGDKVPVQPDPELAGWAFGGWYADGRDGGWQHAWSFDDPVTSDLRLTAKWTQAGGGSGGTGNGGSGGTDNGGSGVTPDAPSSAQGPAGGSTGALPHTGDGALVSVCAAAAVAAASAGVGVALRRRNQG